MLLVDSSIIIAAFRKNEIRHQQALNILAFAEEIIILDYVLSEIATVLKIREGHAIATECLEFLVENQQVHIKQVDKNCLYEAANFFREQKNKLSFVDTILLQYKRVHKISLATFDKELVKRL